MELTSEVIKREGVNCRLCSADMSREIANVLESSGFAHEVVNLVFEDTGHIPPGPADFYPVKAKYIGGNDISNEKARDEAWNATLAFLKRNAE